MNKAEQIRAMHAAHPKWPEHAIARRLKTDARYVRDVLRGGAVQRGAERKRTPPVTIDGKPKANRPAIRACLNCRTYFKSNGWGNLMCPPCLAAPWRDTDAGLAA